MRPADSATPAEGLLARVALRFTALAERWFPDAFIFAAVAVVAVAAAALANGTPAADVARSFGDGFWSLIPFTMQMAFVAIGGYVVATSPPAARLIRALARLPRNGSGAVGLVAAVSMGAALLNWGLSLILGGLLVRALAGRDDLRMDYRAAGAAAYLGLGAVWALGLSSSAAQLQANAASLPKSLLPITGVIPFSQTIFLWQSLLIAAVLIAVSITLCIWSAPTGANAVTAADLGIAPAREAPPPSDAPRHPGEWLEHSPLITLALVALGLGWFVLELSSKDPVSALSNLNTYNLFFLMLGLLLHWRPRSFLDAVGRAVPATTGVLIQFPLYGAIAALMTVKGAADLAIADRIAHLFVGLTTEHSFPLFMGIYSAVLGFFVPSGGGKWLLEAPYVMEAANQLKVHLGWAVQIYNACEALPNLINPFWMLPLLGVLGLKARDIVGFTFLQFVVHMPLVLFLLWALAGTLDYVPPILP